IVQRALDLGVVRLVTICTRVRKLDGIIGIAERYDSVFASVGTHPNNAHEELDVTADDLIKLAEHPKVVAIGEAGLDYHYDYAPPEAQQQGFRTHI
ncbi:TatD family hydrolase, partial [Escherichia coli]|nr:TatD family hydrolase [Escherichia coli]